MLFPESEERTHDAHRCEIIPAVDEEEFPRFTAPELIAHENGRDKTKPVPEGGHETGGDAGRLCIDGGKFEVVCEDERHQEAAKRHDEVRGCHPFCLCLVHRFLCETDDFHPGFSKERSVPEESEDDARDGRCENGRVIDNGGHRKEE